MGWGTVQKKAQELAAASGADPLTPLVGRKVFKQELRHPSMRGPMRGGSSTVDADSSLPFRMPAFEEHRYGGRSLVPGARKRAHDSILDVSGLPPLPLQGILSSSPCNA